MQRQKRQKKFSAGLLNMLPAWPWDFQCWQEGRGGLNMQPEQGAGRESKIIPVGRNALAETACETSAQENTAEN